MPLATQARLLRMLQERAIQPLGAGDPIAVDIRVICASHQDLRQRVRTGEFRQDLYYRLVGTTLTLPPLRERSDRRQLIQQLWAGLRDHNSACRLSAGVMSLLLRHPWPGNIRQLQSVLKVAAGMVDGPQVEVDDLPEDFLADFASAGHAAHAEGQDADLKQLLQASDGNISQLARRLGVSRNTLYKRLRQRHGE
jgi:transcriptional regulator of acetoin/glycerol metabolism